MPNHLASRLVVFEARYPISDILEGMSLRMHVLMRDKKKGKQGQTSNKAKQHSTPKAVTFPKKNEQKNELKNARIKSKAACEHKERMKLNCHLS